MSNFGNDGAHHSRPERRLHGPTLAVATQLPPLPVSLPMDESQSQHDSRSSSSTNSPAPNDNEESDFFLGANDSQSSLGVPNLQDMQVSDDECLPPINRLPNEILISIFARLNASADQLHCMLTCKRWARNAVDMLWHRPACTTWSKHKSICQTLGLEMPFFSYRDFIKRLNLAAIADKVNDGSVMPLAVCTRVERLTLTNCKGLTDTGLIALVQNSSHLLALDISGDDQITEAAIVAIANNCKRLQGLNISNCTKISNDGMIRLAESCRFVKRLKLNDCSQLADESILAFAEYCPNILEIDLHQCRLVSNQPVTNLLAKGQSLRELRLTNCELIDDGAFLSLPPARTYEHLRILDLTSCARLTDRAVEKIIDVAPRLRNLVLAKCRHITDDAVYAIARLGKNLHYVHLGHCGHITDEAVKKLVQACNRIRYIDLGCCTHLTDDSVTRLANLPKLKRIGLVKCSSITDESVFALAKANLRHRQRRDADGNAIENAYYNHSSLERVHLSYCTNLTLRSIIKLLTSCPRLTHLSLTGVPAFLRDDLGQFCRDAPPEFTQHQREVFCVFSGQGVVNLRRYLNNEQAFADLHDRQPPGFPGARRRQNPDGGAGQALAHGLVGVNGNASPNNATDGNFDDADADAIDDDDVLDDGSEMVIDPHPLHESGLGHGHGNDLHPPPQDSPGIYTPEGNYQGPILQAVRFPNDPAAFVQYIPPVPQNPESDDGDGEGEGDVDGDGDNDVMDVSPAGAPEDDADAASNNPLLAILGPVTNPHSSDIGAASTAGSSRAGPGPSTASMQGLANYGRSPMTSPFHSMDGGASTSGSSSGDSPRGS